MLRGKITCAFCLPHHHQRQPSSLSLMDSGDDDGDVNDDDDGDDVDDHIDD